MLASSAIPAIIVFLIRMKLPETPMWLKAHGRDAEARAIVDRHFGPEYAIPEVQPETVHPSPKELLTSPNWKQHLYSGLFWFCQVGPFFAIFTFTGSVFEALGMHDQTLVSMILNILQIAGAVFGLFLLHWLSRRSFVIWTFAAMFVALLAIGLIPNAPLWLIVLMFAGYMFVAPAANNIEYVYPAEIFDTRLRSTGVGFSAAFSRISAASAVYLLPVTLEALGASVTMIIMAMFPLLGLILSIFWAPETKRKVLRRANGCTSGCHCAGAPNVRQTRRRGPMVPPDNGSQGLATALQRPTDADARPHPLRADRFRRQPHAS